MARKGPPIRRSLPPRGLAPSAALARPVAPVDPADLVLVGGVIGAFGVRGALRVRSFTADPTDIGSYGPLFGADGVLVCTPKVVALAKDADVNLTASDVSDRNAAEALKGVKLFVPRARLPNTDDEDEVYVVDLIGCMVLSPTESPVGEVIAVHNFGAGDLLEIKPVVGPNYYCPFTKAAVPELRLSARQIVTDYAPPDPKSKPDTAEAELEGGNS